MTLVQRPGVLLHIYCASSVEPHLPAVNCTSPFGPSGYNSQFPNSCFPQDPAKQSTMITFTNAITGLLSQRISRCSPSLDGKMLKRSCSHYLVTSLSQRIVNAPSTNETSRTRDRSLSRSRWTNVLQRPGLTGQTKSGIELGHVMAMSVSVSVTQDQVTDPAYGEDADADSGKYAHSMKGGAAV